MALRVKIKSVDEQSRTVVLLVNGVECAYLLERPQPLSAFDAQMLRHTMDASFLRAMVDTVSTPKPFLMVRRFFGGLLKKTAYVNVVREDGTTLFLTEQKAHNFFGPKVIAFIEAYGIPFDVEGKKCIALTPDMLAKLEKGDLR